MSEQRPLTRRELREAAQAEAAAKAVESVTGAAAANDPFAGLDLPPTTAATPIVLPPSGAQVMRTLDESGLVAPPQEMDPTPVVPVPAATPTPPRKSIKDAVAATAAELAPPPTQPAFPRPVQPASAQPVVAQDPEAPAAALPPAIPVGGVVNVAEEAADSEETMARKQLSPEELAAYRPSRYTWLHFIILIVVAFVIGMLIWRLLDDGVEFLPGIASAVAPHLTLGSLLT